MYVLCVFVSDRMKCLSKKEKQKTKQQQQQQQQQQQTNSQTKELWHNFLR